MLKGQIEHTWILSNLNYKDVILFFNMCNGLSNKCPSLDCQVLAETRQIESAICAELFLWNKEGTFEILLHEEELEMIEFIAVGMDDDEGDLKT